MQSFKEGGKEPPIDISFIKALDDKHKEQLSGAKDIEPHELPQMDSRLREGEKHSDDQIDIDGTSVAIPQLTIMDMRKIQARSLTQLAGSSLGKKLVMATRSEVSLDEKVELTEDERVMLGDVGIEEDYWLANFVLTREKHPKITGNKENDRQWIGTLPCFDQLVALIRKCNFIDKDGDKRMRFFRNNGLREPVKT